MFRYEGRVSSLYCWPFPRYCAVLRIDQYENRVKRIGSTVERSAGKKINAVLEE